MFFQLFISFLALSSSSSRHEYFYNFANSSSYPSGTCNTRYFTCVSKYPKNSIINKFPGHPYDCCKTCLSNSNCQSWLHYYENSTLGYQYVITDYPKCILFNINININNTGTNLTQGNCIVGSKYVSSQPRPNWLIYYPDTIRAEYMTMYNYPLNTTPNINKLASNGVTFNSHIAQHSECSPSRCAMLTGRYMHTNGYRTLTSLIQYWQPNYLRLMKDNGYYIYWVGKNDAFSIDAFQLSVTEWHDILGVIHGVNKFRYGEEGYYSMLYTGSPLYPNSTLNGDHLAAKLAEKFLKSKPIEPFLIFLPGLGGHPPYGAPKGYYDMYDPDEIKKIYPRRQPYPPNKPKYYSKTEGIPYWHNLTNFNDSLFYKINSVYLGLVSYMDYNFGLVYDSVLEYDKNHSSSTGIFMSSDHGDYSGDYNFVEKWPGGMDDNLIHIPLIAKLPNNISYNGGIIKQTTQSFDIFSTILDVSNINITFTHFGKSLKDLIIEPNNETPNDYYKYAYSEGGLYYYNEIFPNGSDHLHYKRSLYWPKNAEEMADNGKGCPRVVSMQNVYYKLIFREEEYVSEFYDLQKDPKTLNNLYYNNNDSNVMNIIRQMERNLTQWYLLTSDATPILMDPRPDPIPYFEYN